MQLHPGINSLQLEGEVCGSPPGPLDAGVSDHSGDFADATSNLMQRVRTIYDEGCKVVEEAGELWSHGRKLVSR